MSSRKSCTKSEKLRAEANRLYVQKKFYDALLKYNESLCCAEAESENLGLAYANRSAVYFEMKLYDKCLLNIDMAKRNRYPEKNFEILQKREEKCLELIKQHKSEVKPDAWNFFKLSYPPNKKLPFIVDCLEMKNDQKYGRHIVTNRALKVGDIIAIDDPTFKVVKADSRYSTCFESNTFQRCANCLHENLFSLIPCLSCCKTMYCSTECMTSAQRRHHQYECEIIDELLTSGIMHIVVRMFFEGLSLFDDDIHEMEMFLNQHQQTITIFDHENVKDNRKTEFLATIALASNKSQPSLDDYEILFQKTTKLKSMWMTSEKFIRQLLSNLIDVGTLYVHGIGGWCLKDNSNENEVKNPSCYQQLIGNGCYLFCSLLNHSCAPNIKRLNVDDKVVIIVSRMIAKGEQLFDSYRLNFNNQSKAQRQEALMKDYGFICDCEACVYDWPMNNKLEVINDKLLEFAWTAHEDLPFMTVDDAKQKLKKYCEVIAKNQKYFPSAELIVLQECVSNCLIAITKPALQFS